MFNLFRKSQSDALAPLVELARSRFGYDRKVFLSELRRDAPTVAAMIEQQLEMEETTLSATDSRVTSVSATPAVRQDARSAVAFTHVSSLSTTGG